VLEVPKTNVVVKKTDLGRLHSIEVQGKERFKAQFYYDSKGLLSSMDVNGRNVPRATELFRLVKDSFIDSINVIDQINNIKKIDEVHVFNATLQNVVEGFDYTERWERGYFDRRKYFGRTEPYYLTEAEEPPPYTVPPLIKNVNTIQPVPWNNAIWMRNSKDGARLDEVYFGIPLSFNRAVLRLDALLPDDGDLGIDDHIGWGFECCSQGGTACFYIHGTNSNYFLSANYMSRLGAQFETVAVAFPHMTQWSTYWLVFDPPIVRLYEIWLGAYTILATLPLTQASIGGIWVCPFFCNESATSIVDNFYLGNISVFKLSNQQMTGVDTEPANTAVVSYIVPTGDARELEVWAHSVGGNLNAHSLTLEVSQDTASWLTVDTLALPAATDFFTHWGETHLATTGSRITNPVIWAYLRITLPALGAGVTGYLKWALK
jgi:hypothetical protein